MSVKSKVKRCNKEIEILHKEINKLKEQMNKKSSKEQLYENIIKFAITNHIGGLNGGMMIDGIGIDKMNSLKLDIERDYVERTYIIRVGY